MATVGHVAIGLAAARLQSTAPARAWPGSGAWIFWTLLAVLPDADFFLILLGLTEYGAPWGHRGATHSLTFALAVGTAIGLAAPAFRAAVVRTGIMAILVLASHPLLDMLTDGGRGCAIFWPFDNTRYVAPWNPLPVAPLGLDLISAYGVYVIAFELVVFSPLLWFALRPGRAVKRSG